MGRANSFGAKKVFSFSGTNAEYFSLPHLETTGVGQISKLPFSIRVLIEALLRREDGLTYLESHVKALANWQPQSLERVEIPFMPARVVLQDFTGVPAVVDLASMRDAMVKRGGQPSKINPLVPCDLVIDHSVQVDYYGNNQAIAKNEIVEFERNSERYRLLKWAQGAFNNFRVVPPSMGIVHQVNLEYLSSVAFWNKEKNVVYPDSCVGTDSHTTMTNGLGVLSWGVGGIEAEAVMLDQPVFMLVPDVVGVRLSGRIGQGVTATDVVLRITEMLRKVGVVGKFVEFFGSGVSELSLADRATISNMAPEQGSTVTFFPVDKETLRYLRLSGRSLEQISLVEAYYKEQGLFNTVDTPEPVFTQVVDLDLGTVEASVAGPKRPHDRIALTQVSREFAQGLTAPVGIKGFGIDAEKSGAETDIVFPDGTREVLKHGSVVIAAITSCTNTSNPSVMLGAGLLAKKAVEKGLKIPKFVKTSLAPGSRVVTEYLRKAGLLESLETLGFNVVGYGCTTCIGNSGPLSDEVTKAITDNDLVVSAVLSGNRNFEGRVSPLTRSNYLASPPLVVAYALLGSTALDITTAPLGKGSDGKPVYLKDIWPTREEILSLEDVVIEGTLFSREYEKVWSGSEAWQKIEASRTELFPWDDNSTYIQDPPFFSTCDGVDVSKGVCEEGRKIVSINSARVLGKFGDSVTTDHISPAGSIAKNSPAGKFLESHGIERHDWNSYGARRGNHLVMMRGTFANTRLRNQLVPGSEGNVTIHFPTAQQMSFFDASEKYRAENTGLIILAGKEYGSGSSRDWAAKGPFLLGVKAAIAQSFERIHRSNLIGMGVMPLEFLPGESAESLGLTGEEIYDIDLDDNHKPQQLVTVRAINAAGNASSKDGAKVKTFTVKSRIDTPVEVDYYRKGGILQYVLETL